MTRSKPLLAILAAGTLGVPFGAPAQLGFYQLPKNDFVWNWGRGGREGVAGRFEDFSVNGSEAGFQCELTGRFSALSDLTPTQINAFENELRTRMDFIYASATYMNDLDRQHALDWARLQCKKFEPAPSTPEQKAEREAKAREKMQREIERRRERQGDK